MPIQVTAVVAGGRPAPAVRPAKAALLVLSVVALAAGGAVILRGDAATVDNDLVRVLRFMAALKGVFALAAWVGSFWRLARPAAPWRTMIYVAGPPLMIAGASAMWAMRDLGLAALGLHLGLFAVLAAALTDPDFFGRSRLRSRPRS